MERRKRVLVVDDEASNLELLEAFLTGMGHEVDMATDGYAALAKLDSSHDLVLLDVIMPGIDGFEVARRIRNESAVPDIPICMVTALSNKAERLHAVEAGASDFIAKPVDKTELQVRTASLLRAKETQDAAKRYRAELEAAKEELQSLNEKLTMVNTQLSEKVNELTATNDDLANLMNATQVATVFLDRQLRILRFTPSATELLDLIPSDRGRPLSHITQNIVDDSLVTDAKKVINDLTPIEAEVQTQGRRWFTVRILPYRTLDDQIEGVVITFSDVTRLKETQEKLECEREYASSIVETVRNPLIVLNGDLRVLSANSAFYGMFQVKPEVTVGQLIYDLGNRQWGIPKLRKLLETILPQKTTFDNYEIEHDFSTIGQRIMFLNARQIQRGSGKERIILLAIEDITDRKKMEGALRTAHAEIEQQVEERTLELRTALSEIKTMKDQLEAENIYFRHENKIRHEFPQIIGQSDGLRHVLFRAEQVAPTNTTVLVLGETGTGKELIAAAIHNMSPRKERPLITVNCAALPGSLIESELFGREKGAFTGADTRRIGRFEVAHGSTLCLDEIGELPLELQAKLLRVIQHNEFQRLGSSHTIKVDVRIIATTNRDLEDEVRKGRFRQDLYYRLNVFPVTVPPLRQRKEDIPLMVQSFMERYSRKLGKSITSIQKETMKALQDYPWPGNVRELESIIERTVILCPGPVLQLADKLEISFPLLLSAARTLEETERNQILKILSETRWRIEGIDGAAAILGLHPSTLRARMHKLGIVRPETTEPD